MPRFFFDFHDGEVVTLDDEGTELTDMQTARDEATDTFVGIAKDSLPPNGRARQLRRLSYSSPPTAKLFKGYSNGGRAGPLRDFATATLPTLTMHLDMIHSMAGQ